MAEGFKLADAFVEVNLRDRTKPGILKIRREVEGIDDRTVHINVDVDKAGKKLSSFLGSATKGMLAVGSAANAGGAIAGLGASLVSLSGTLLALPAVALAGGAAMGTLALATTGFSDALTGSAKAQAEAYEKMGAGARGLVDTLKGLGPEANKLRQSVQDAAVAGLSDDVKVLAGTYLPLLKTGLTGVSTEMNGMARYAAKALMAPGAVKDVNSVLGGTKDLFHNLKPAIGDSLTGLLDLGAVGSQYLGRLGTSITDVTGKFKAWAEESAKSGRFNELIDQGIDTAKTFGRILGNVGDIASTVFKGLSSGNGDFLGGLEKTTAEVGKFLKSVEGQSALKSLGETLKVVGDVARDVLLTALREFGPVITEAGPAIQAFARGLGTFLVEAMRVAGPLLQGMARFLSENSDSVAELAPLIGGLVVAIKGLSILSSVKGWVTGAMGALKLLGGADVGALGKTGGITWGKGFVGGLGLAGIGVGATLLLDEVIPKDAGKSYGAGFARDMLGQMSSVFKGQGSPIDTQQVAQWISNPVLMGVEAAKRGLMGLFGLATSNLPAIKFDVNTGPARDQVVGFMNSLKGKVGTVEINGRTEDASQALAEIIQRINTGNGDVTINGQTMPASQALDQVVKQINEQGGTVDINGDPVPAGDALRMFVTAANASTGIVTITGNTDPATGKVNAVLQFADGSTGTVTLDGNPSLVNGKTVQAVRFADGSRGTVTIDGNPDPATGKVAATVRYADGRTGRIMVDARTGAANDAIDWAARNRTSTITVRYTDPGGLVRTQNPNLPGSFGRAVGGPIGRSSGGPIRGPGTGTSDSILAIAGRTQYRLSNGEHVVTAAEVRAAGGHEGMYAIREALRSGGVAGSGSGPAAVSSPSAGAPSMNIGTVVIDAQSITELQSLAAFFDRVQSAARQGGSSLAGVRH